MTDDLVWSEEYGMWHRPSQDHLKMIQEARRVWMAAAPRPGERVVDLGAHVGGYSVWAARDCRADVWAYEAAPDTYEVLCKNAEPHLQHMDVTHAAVVGGPSGTVTLWLSPNHKARGSCMASVHERRGRTPVEVPALNFDQIMRKVRPHVVKIDVEGAELDYEFIHDPKFTPRVMALELHVQKPDMAQRARELIDRLRMSERWRLISGDRAMYREPLDFGTAWGINTVWSSL